MRELVDFIVLFISEKDAQLAVESASGLLQAEIIVKLFVEDVSALERQVVASVLYAVAHRQIMRELVGNHKLVVCASDYFRQV